MITGQAAVGLAAVAVCILFAKRLGFAPVRSGSAIQCAPCVKRIVQFGGMQLMSMIGINAAGWWVTTLVARADLTLVQAAWYTVAMQLRNICGMGPLLISQTGYSLLSGPAGERHGGPGRVAALCTFAATIIALLIIGPMASITPWVVSGAYGEGYAGAELPVTLAIATALVHMSSASAAARLTIVSLELTGIINGIWAAAVIGLGSWLVPLGGAAAASATFLAAHTLSAVLVLVGLLWLKEAPWSLVALSVPGLAGAVLLSWLGWLRAAHSSLTAPLSAAMLGATIAFLCLTLYLGLKTRAIDGATPVLRQIQLAATIRAPWLSKRT
jgi:hypothetical protein